MLSFRIVEPKAFEPDLAVEFGICFANALRGLRCAPCVTRGKRFSPIEYTLVRLHQRNLQESGIMLFVSPLPPHTLLKERWLARLATNCIASKQRAGAEI